MQPNLPSIMRAINCHHFGAPEVMEWAEVSVPVPQAGEVLIKVVAAGVNRADILQRQGKYQPPSGASDIMGMEVSGTVVALAPDVTRWKMGDKVCALLSGGGYAEYVAISQDQCLSIPENLSFVESAALPECIVTVWANVFEMAALKPGETLLVHGGSSGIGTTAIQMVKLWGSKIFVTAGSEEKCAACRKLGTDLAIHYKNEDFVTVILQATAGRGVNAVLDMVGGDYIARNIAAMAPFGRHVSIATQKGRMASIDLRDIMLKRLTLTGSTLRGRPAAEKARLVAEVKKKVWPWVRDGRLKPLIYKVMPIKNVPLAHKMMESGEHIGKIVLEVSA